MTPALNKALPEFEALATRGVKFTPQAFKGNAVVLYFYPKDHTPGCTTEAMQFRDSTPSSSRPARSYLAFRATTWRRTTSSSRASSCRSN